MLPHSPRRRMGTCLGRVTDDYNVGGGVAFRVTQRACTAATVSFNIPVTAVTGAVKRTGVGVARRCTHILPRGVVGSVGILGATARALRALCRWAAVL